MFATVGITSGASVPGTVSTGIRRVLSAPRRGGEQIGLVDENIHFALPCEVTALK